ncbi:MAG TPA: TonB-dependent receptor [Bryobacteraceae bacterium]|nr:TonB-dependent receptor [Bryobacteraceae bacterium]
MHLLVGSRKTWYKLLACFVGLVLATAVVWAQAETGQISGTVLDQSGAAIPNATVTAVNTATGATRTTVTGAGGAYTITNLNPATYEVTFTAASFTSARQRVEVTVGAKATLDAQLKVGGTTTTIEVAESAVQVNTESQTLSTNVSETQVRELPTLTRNAYALVAISGNVSDAGAGGRGAGFAINGQRESSTNVLLDGAANNDEFTASVGQAVPLDSIQEFSILTNNFTAEFGRAAGGVVNVVTKSGTNGFHGSGYEFNRVSALSSNSFQNNAQGVPKSVFDRNQFGYSVGGPVKKDKLFFFNSTEWIRVRSTAETFVMTPDPWLISQSAANTQQFFSTYGKLASGSSVLKTYSINQLTAQGTNLCGTSPKCLALNPNMPVYDLTGYAAPGDAGGGSPQNQYQTVARVDYNLSDKTQLYGRYALQSELFFNGIISSSPYAGYNTGETDFNNNALFSIIHTFSPRWVSQSKVVFNRLNQQQPFSDTYGPVPTLYTTPTGAGQLLGYYINYPGFDPNTPGNGIPFGGPQNFVQLYQDMNYTRGKHSIRFGGSFEYMRDNRTFGAYETAGEYLSSGKLGSAVDNFMTGNLYRYQAAINPQGHYPGEQVNLPVGQPNFSRSFRYRESALYVQDAWRVTPRLTMNLGLRWEYYGVQHNKDPKLDSNYFMPDGSIGTPIGISKGVAQPVLSSSVGGFWAPTYNNFAPRIGAAWDVFGDGKTSIRGGYGIGYERNFGNVTFNAIQNPPNYETVSITAGTSNWPGTLPISVANLGPFASGSGTITLPAATLRVPIQNIKTARAHFWSVSLERRILNGLLVGADYSGSRGVDLYDISVDNRYGYGNVYLGIPCSYDAENCTAVLNSKYSGINVRGNNAWSNYNALNLRTRVDNIKNSGLNLTFNYTWSHAIDNLSSSFSDADAFSNNWGTQETGLLDPFNPNVTKGNADFDIRHRAVVSAIWDIPAYKTGHNLKAQIFGGWSIAPILTMRSGSPYTLFDCTNAYNFCTMAAFTAPVTTAANGNPSPSAGQTNQFDFLTIQPSIIDHFTNPKYFWSDLPPYPADMSSRNAFRAPGFYELDMGLYKSFRFGERFRMQLRGEAYNLFNHANMYVEANSIDLSGTNVVQACKGCTGGTADRRNIQLAARFTF